MDKPTPLVPLVPPDASVSQRRSLNDVLRKEVVLKTSDAHGNVARVGYGPLQRAALLGVDANSIRKWDRASTLVLDPETAPTHYRNADGRIQPLRRSEYRPRLSTTRRRGPTARPTPLRKTRPAPPWLRAFVTWCRREARPADSATLLRIDAEIHDALVETGVVCSHSEGRK